MAIIWDCKINNIDPEHFRADVNFNRVNDLTGAEENYNYSRVIIETAEQRVALLDLCWTEHLETIAKQTAINAFISNLEQLAKSNLEAREV
jgi:cytolysin (calcineurin-like family phosphatase)